MVVFIITLILIVKHQKELDALITNLENESATLTSLFSERFPTSLDALETLYERRKTPPSHS